MVRLIKESFNSDRYEEAQNYINNGMTTWREIFQDCLEIARTDKELHQSMIDQCGSISKYAEEIFGAVQDILGNEANESVKRGNNKRRMKEGLPVYLKGDNDDKSRFLSRFISDVKYWISLGKTPEADKFLWAGTPEEQAQVIQDTFDAITDQADRVLTQADIDYYVGELLNRYNESVKRGSRKRRNKRC